MRARRRRPASWPAVAGCRRRCGWCGAAVRRTCVALAPRRSGRAAFAVRRARSAAARTGRRRSPRETRPSGHVPRRIRRTRPNRCARSCGTPKAPRCGSAGARAMPSRSCRRGSGAQPRARRRRPARPRARGWRRRRSRRRRRRTPAATCVRAGRRRSAPRSSTASVTSTTVTRGSTDAATRAVSSVHPLATTTSSMAPSGSPAMMRSSIGADDARLVVGRDHDADARHDPTAMVRTGTCVRGSSGVSCAAAAVGASTSSQAPTASSMQNSRKVCMNPNAS